MKQFQVAFALILLAAMVFVVTFAMNFLGGGAGPRAGAEPKQQLELLFANKVHPEDNFSSVEREEKSSGHHDYWFCNTNAKPVRLGLAGKNCKCSNVEVYLLGAEASRKLLGDKAIDGPESLAKLLATAMAQPEAERQAARTELQQESDFATVPAGGVGWARVVYKGEKSGPQMVSAKMWMDDPRQGPTATLELRLTFHEALRVQQTLDFGTLTEDEIARGVTDYIYCYSAIRSDLKPPEATAARSKGGPESDPLVIGKAVPLSDKEREEMLQRMKQARPDPTDAPVTKALSAFKIPVTVNAVSSDGKTPFDLGPFRRRVLISSPGLDGEPKSVVIHGRVRGLIEVGNDEDSGDLNFRSFPRAVGRSLKLPLHSNTAGVKLEVDPQRTAAFLKASLQQVGDRSNWTLNVEVLPNRASGPFPRRDPLYEDSAVYLKATAPGKPPRPVRIGVTGTAAEG
jgi:hypothetical protein